MSVLPLNRWSIAVPLYNFVSYNGSNAAETVVMSLDGLLAAKKRATRLSGLLIETASHGMDVADDWRIDVTDEDGLVLYRIAFTTTHTPDADGLLTSATTQPNETVAVAGRPAVPTSPMPARASAK